LHNGGNDTPEKNLNLNISARFKDLCKNALGWETEAEREMFDEKSMVKDLVRPSFQVRD
jgi:hypothetical protein